MAVILLHFALLFKAKIPYKINVSGVVDQTLHTLLYVLSSYLPPAFVNQFVEYPVIDGGAVFLSNDNLFRNIQCPSLYLLSRLYIGVPTSIRFPSGS